MQGTSVCEKKTSRLEIRVNTSVYEMIREAAAIDDVSISAFVLSAAQEKAEQRIERNSMIRLSREGQIAFAEALLRGRREDTPAMAEAKRLRSELIRKEL